jgi:multidrug resistance efflux pump
MPYLSKLVKRLGASAALWACLCACTAGQTPPSDESVIVSGCRLTYVDAVTLSSERAGVLAEIAEPGAALAAGQDVARLRDGVLKASLAIAEREASNDVDVRFAAKAAELAELKYERALQANRTHVGTVSDLELRELRLAADRAALQFEQAEHRLAVAALRLEEIRATVATLSVAAPFAARVRATYKRPGEVVQQGEIIAEIVNTDRVRVEGDVDLGDLSWVAVQAEVYVQLDGALVPPEMAQGVFPGVITFVDVKVEPVSKKVHIAAEVDNRAGLLREGLPAVMLIPRVQTAERHASTR